MASGSKREKIKAFIRNPFSSSKKGKAVSNDVPNDTSTTPLPTGSSDAVVKNPPPTSSSAPKIVVSESLLQAPVIYTSSSDGILPNASHFTMHEPVMVDISRNTTVNIHGASDRQSKAMERLSKHSIPGVAHDSSARDPPPRCHPGTRIKINDHIITWFYDKEKEELLIWVYGSAGVGKSAIMQTLVEKLAKSKHLGASAFVSRPNGCNDSQKLFITVAYQLAVHIDDYCTFITEKLGRDPELVNKGMEVQFESFIVEPFVEKKIGAGAQPWGILLDGLDELDEHRSQRAVIRLITNFVLEHPDTPLLWLIASRPEPHILDTFDKETVVPAYRKEYVPTDSKESRRDVERFLKDKLKGIQEDFPRTVPKEWPSEEQYSSLAAAASGLFEFAATAIRFIEDPCYANPTMRLRQVLSALNGPPSTVSDNQPFDSLDALYTSILDSIPSDVWPTTKQVFGTLLYARGEGVRYMLGRLGPMSIVLGLDLSMVYASINSCYALLNGYDPEDAYWIPTTFYHASFSDYLLNSSRSQNFHISIRDIEDELLQSSLNIWQDFQTKYPPTSGLTYENRWIKYFSALFPFKQNTHVFQHALTSHIHEALFTFLVERHNSEKKELFLSEEDKDQFFNVLHQLEDATMCHGFEENNKLSEFLVWLFGMWEVYQEELISRGVIREVGLKQAQFSQLGTCPAHMKFIQGKSTLYEERYDMDNFGDVLTAISQHESWFSQLPVLACGSPGKGCLVFRHQINVLHSDDHGLNASEEHIWIYFAIPFPHSTFYHDAEHFLSTSFETISANYPQTKAWPSKEQFQKLADAVSHYPVFATIAMEFIGNSHYGNPMACLDQLIALIDEVDPSDDQPFIYVDALYSHILNSIPSDTWPTTQQILGALLYSTTEPLYATLKSLKGLSVVLGIDLSVVYAALSGCSLMVQIPPENGSLETVAFHHYPFCEFLMDPTRSKHFYIAVEDAKDHVLKLLINIWQDFRKFSHGVPRQEYPSIWHNYCLQYHLDADSSNKPQRTDFNFNLYNDTHNALFLSIQLYDSDQLESKQSQDYVFHILRQLDFTAICKGFWKCLDIFVIWLFDIWKTCEELRSEGLFHEIQFQDLQLDRLEYHDVNCHVVHCISGQTVERELGNELNSPEELEGYISGLQLFQKHRPQLPVLIGGCPGEQFAVFVYEYTEDDLKEQLHQPQTQKQKAGDLGYYCLPYSDGV